MSNPTKPPADRDAATRVRLLHMTAAGLGAVSLLVGLLPFYTSGNNGLSGYALSTPTSAAIGFSVFAGLLSLAELLPGAAGRTPTVPPPPPTLGLAAALTALLVGVANVVARGSLSGDLSFGFVVFLVGLLVQNAVLGYLWLSPPGRVGGAVAAGPPQPGARPSVVVDIAQPLYGPFYPPQYSSPYPVGPPSMPPPGPYSGGYPGPAPSPYPPTR